MQSTERNNLEQILLKRMVNNSRLKAVAKQAYKFMTYDERKKLGLIKNKT